MNFFLCLSVFAALFASSKSFFQSYKKIESALNSFYFQKGHAIKCYTWSLPSSLTSVAGTVASNPTSFQKIGWTYALSAANIAKECGTGFTNCFVKKI